MHDTNISQEVFDNIFEELQASANTDIDVASEDDSILAGPSSDYMIESIEGGRSLPPCLEFPQQEADARGCRPAPYQQDSSNIRPFLFVSDERNENRSQAI
jgi:hypothetical protein